MGWKIKEDAAEAFGGEGILMVRKEMVNDSIGYRSAGVTDPWTGITRWSPETQKRMQGMATAILGKNAYTYLAKAETAVGDLVSYAKTTIIVRSFVVARDNLISNVYQLMMAGINPVDVAKGMRNKFIEITEHVKNREDIKKLEVDLAASIRNPTETKKIRARIQALEQANKRMSISPLIEAGEFSTISENLTEADVAIREGKWGEYMEKVTKKLPGWVQTGVKNLAITKDTALFQGLNRMVQYGDFVAKAVRTA